MDRVRQTLAHLLSTLGPIRPSLMDAMSLLRGHARPILVMLVMCILAVTGVREVSNYWVDHWLSGRMPQFDQQLEFCKIAREHPNDITRGLCQSTVFRFMRQVILHNTIGDTIRLSAATIVTVILYLWTSARLSPRLTIPPERMASALMRREPVYACLAAVAILLAPVFLFHFLKIAHGFFPGLWEIRLFSPTSHTVLRGSLSAAWFLIAAPFVLPAVPLALTSSRRASLAEATRLGWSRYLQFVALAAATAAPFIGVAAFANWSVRARVISFLGSRLDLGSYLGRAFFEMLLTTFALVAVVAIAAAFTVAVGRRMQEAR